MKRLGIVSNHLLQSAPSTTAEPVRVVVTGAGGNIGYALVFHIASGDMFGRDQPVCLHLLETEHSLPTLRGLHMELEDCSFPLLREVVLTADYAEGFKEVDYAVLVGAMPRREGMVRADLLKANVGIFKGQGEALDKYAKKTVKVLVVGNPANTNAAVCARYAPSIAAENFSALTRLDHNRAVGLVSRHLGVGVETVEGVVIWGNHSGTQYADVTHARAGGAAVLTEESKSFFRGEFIGTIQKRGAAVIAARKSSSAASAAKAIVDHVRDWHTGTGERVVSMAVPSGAYGIEKGIIFSYPVKIDAAGKVHVVTGLFVDPFSRRMLDTTEAELRSELQLALSTVQTK